MPSRPNKGQWYAIRLIFNNRLYPCHSVCTRLSPLLSRLPAQVPEGKGVNFPVTLYTSLRGRNPPWKGVNYGNGNKKNSEPWVLHRSRILTGGGGSPLPEVSTADGNCSCSTAISNEMSWDERLNVEVSVLEVDIADGDLSHKRPSDLFAARMAVALGNKTGWNLFDFAWNFRSWRWREIVDNTSFKKNKADPNPTTHSKTLSIGDLPTIHRNKLSAIKLQNEIQSCKSSHWWPWTVNV